MRQTNDWMKDILCMDAAEAANDVIWRACKPAAVREKSGDVLLDIPFAAQEPGLAIKENAAVARRSHQLRVRGYAGSVLRLSIAFEGKPAGDESLMLDLHPTMTRDKLSCRTTDVGWEIMDQDGTLRMRITTADEPVRNWAQATWGDPAETLVATLYPDGKTAVPLTTWDQFIPTKHDSVTLGYIDRAGQVRGSMWSLHAEASECFAGTGERFAKMDLSGRNIVLQNRDALGVNNMRAYKNIPFYLSSRPYGLFVHSSAHIGLSLAGASTRAAQGIAEEAGLDLFVIGGGTPERILYNYRRLTGFPPELPLWSYGTWMSRMSYFSAEEIEGIAARLRKEKFPCDVLHIDTGWFATDWVCEWEFSKERFPDPSGFMSRLKKDGFRVSLWQTPNIGKNNKLREEAIANRYIVPKKSTAAGSSDFSGQEFAGTIDFSNPAAVRWYQSMLRRLLRMGAAAIKTDFGESIDMNGQYHSMPASLLHNLYALLYQKAAFEVTKKTTGEGIVWARAGWAGCQRYPLHWGGDAASTWDGLAASLRGGLHFGLSGFAFWSHDVPGFHGSPNFMSTWPADDLYVRWTQLGVFSSHFRYHGTTPREPWEYPQIASIIRQWLNLRYALIPYIVDQAAASVRSGMPLLRAMALHHSNDRACWHIDDQYYFGDSLLVAPVMNASGYRDIYLPEGEWLDFWSNRRLKGNRWHRNVKYSLRQMPIFARQGSSIRVYPLPVQCTDEIDMDKAVTINFNSSWKGLHRSVLSELVKLKV